MVITMLGGTGSGKTCFMAGINQTFINNSVNGIQLDPNPYGKISFEEYRILQALGFINLNNNTLQFPAPTTETTDLTFILKLNDKPICDFQWTDYKGGFIRDTFSYSEESERKDAADLQDRILISDALMVFIDAIMLSNIEDNSQCKHVTFIHQIQNVISQYSKKYSKYNKAIAFVLTKCDSDLIPEPYKENHYAKLIEKAKLAASEIIQVAQRMQWPCAIIPVSAVGQSTASEKKEVQARNSIIPFHVDCQLVKYPHSQNIDIALLFCVVEILKRMLHTTQRDLDKTELEYAKILSQNSLFKNWWEQLHGRVTPSELLDRLLQKKREELAVLALMSEHVDALNTFVRGKVTYV